MNSTLAPSEGELSWRSDMREGFPECIFQSAYSKGVLVKGALTHEYLLGIMTSTE